eukprot:evm.model.NODE_37712_length_4867_cov_33.652351.1
MASMPLVGRGGSLCVFLLLLLGIGTTHAFVLPTPSSRQPSTSIICTPSTAAVLYATRKKKGGSGAGEGFGQTQKKREAARAPAPAPSSAPAAGEEVKEERLEDATKAAKENFKAKLMEVGSSLQALASQVDARSGDGE